SIRARMEKKWEGHADAAAKVEASVANSKKRSAGTNFQSLVSYALAKYLLETDSAWFVAHPVPKEFRESLAITFTAGIPLQGDEVSPAPPAEVEEAVEEMLAEDNEATAGGEDDKEEGEEQDVADDAETLATVNPDVDILLRNANWLPALGKREPVGLLSVKTSIIDRGGSAARWKMYFDLASDPCELACDERCGVPHEKWTRSQGLR